MEKFKDILKKLFANKNWLIYLFVFLFLVKCTQNCSKQGVIRYQETNIEQKDSIIEAQKSRINEDSIVIIWQAHKIESLEQSLRMFDKAYDAQLKQQKENNKQQAKVNSLIQKVDSLNKKMQ